MTPLTVKLLTPHREGCEDRHWVPKPYAKFKYQCRDTDCQAEAWIDAHSLDRAIAEALEEKEQPPGRIVVCGKRLISGVYCQQPPDHEGPCNRKYTPGEEGG